MQRKILWLVVGIELLILASPLAHAATVAVGGNHTCAITQDGSVKCWGNNSSGQLGNGQSGSQQPNLTSPSLVKFDVNARAVDITAGPHFTCAQLDNNQVYCWGGGLAPFQKTVGTPIYVGGLQPVELVAGGASICAMVNPPQNRAITCLGELKNPMLGPLPALTFNGAGSAVPHPAEHIVEGLKHVCFLTDKGSVQCFGNNGDGQLGNGLFYAGPAEAVGMPDLGGPVIALAAGGGHTCGVVQDGTVKCWGRNTSGQLGDGTIINSAVPVTVKDLTDVKAMAAGADFTCALQNSGVVKCWGAGGLGQLGSATVISVAVGMSSTVPVAVTVTQGFKNVVALTASGASQHICVTLATGELRCWGRADKGQLGIDPKSGSLSQYSGGSYSGSPIGVTGVTVKVPPETVPAFVTFPAGCPAGQSWDGQGKQCVGLLKDVKFATTTVWKVQEATIFKLHQELTQAALAAGAAQRNWQTALQQAMEPKIDELFAKAEADAKKSSSAAQSKTRAPVQGVKKIGTALTTIKLAPVGVFTATIADLKKTADVTKKKMEDAFDPFHAALQSVLNADASKDGNAGKDIIVKVSKLYLSGLFALSVQQPLLPTPDAKVADPVADETLLKYLSGYRKGDAAKSNLQTLVNRFQELPQGLADLTDKSLFSAYSLTTALVKARQPGLADVVRDNLLAALGPMLYPLVDRTKRDIPATPSLLLLEQIAIRENSIPLNSTTTNTGVQLEPYWLYLWNPATKKMEEVPLCATTAANVAMQASGVKGTIKDALPKTTDGPSPHTVLGVTDAQIAATSCGTAPLSFPVWSDKYQCLIFRNFANAAVNPVLLGHATCPFWNTVRLGKGCGDPVCPAKKTSMLTPRPDSWMRRIAQSFASVRDWFEIPSAYAQSSSTGMTWFKRVTPARTVIPRASAVPSSAANPATPPSSDPVKDPYALPLGISLEQVNFIKGSRVSTDTTKPDRPKLPRAVMTLTQATDRMIDSSPVIVRGVPASQSIYPISADPKTQLYAADTVISVAEVLRGKDIGKTLTIRDIQVCVDGVAECTKGDKQRVALGAPESVYFLVPGSDEGIWRLTDHALGHGALSAGKIKGIERSVDEVRARIQKSTPAVAPAPSGGRP